MRYNSHTESVADGHLKIATEPGDINGNNPIQPRNFILQDAPAGDWVAETKLKAPLKHRYQLAGLLMYGNDDNYAKADIVAYNNPGTALDLRAELAAEKGGNGVAGGDAVNIPDTTESGYWWVQVTKVGTNYTAAVKATAGASWTPIGDGITYDGPLNSLGLMAIGPEPGGADHGRVRLLPPRHRGRAAGRRDRAGHDGQPGRGRGRRAGHADRDRRDRWVRRGVHRVPDRRG